MCKSNSVIFLFLLLFTIPSGPQNYDIRWDKGPDFPVRLSEIKAITCNDKIYVIGGKITKDNDDLNDNEDVDFIYEYDPAKNTWTKKANMPSKRYDVALAVVNNKIYAISTKNEVYDPVSNTWQVLAPLPGGMAHLEAAVVNEKIYIFGSEEGVYKKTMMYDPQKNTWMEKRSIPTPRLAPSIAVVDDKIYVMGGIGFDEKDQLGKLLQNIEVYDPANDSWETKKPMLKPLWGSEGAIVRDKKVFLINIRSSESNPLNNIYVYDPDTEDWSTATNLPKCFSEQGITFLNNRIYVIGGHDNTFTQYDDVFIGEFINTNGEGERYPK